MHVFDASPTDTARYDEIRAPPVFVGAVQLTFAEPSLDSAVTDVGEPGATARVATAEDTADAEPVPIAFFAETRNT